MRFTTLALLLLCFASAAGPAAARQGAPAPSPSPSPAAAAQPKIPPPSPAPEDPKITKLAIGQFVAWQNGDIDQSLYDPQVTDELTEDVLTRGTAALAHLGGLQKATFEGISQARGTSFYVYKMTCENGSVDMDFAIDPATGKIALIFFE